MDAKNRGEIGDTLGIMSPNGSRRIRLEKMESEKGEQREAAPGSGHVVRIALDIRGIGECSLILKEIATPLHS